MKTFQPAEIRCKYYSGDTLTVKQEAAHTVHVSFGTEDSTDTAYVAMDLSRVIELKNAVDAAVEVLAYNETEKDKLTTNSNGEYPRISCALVCSDTVHIRHAPMHTYIVVEESGGRAAIALTKADLATLVTQIQKELFNAS